MISKVYNHFQMAKKYFLLLKKLQICRESMSGFRWWRSCQISANRAHCPHSGCTAGSRGADSADFLPKLLIYWFFLKKSIKLKFFSHTNCTVSNLHFRSHQLWLIFFYIQWQIYSPDSWQTKKLQFTLMRNYKPYDDWTLRRHL